jgi:dihydrofolate reductase
MPWFFPEDAAFFNAQTTNHICIMGRGTAFDLGKPLTDRDCIVISSKDDLHPDFTIVRTFDDALKKAASWASTYKQIFVIGGAKLFNSLLQSKYLNKIYYTHIDRSFNCDKFVAPLLMIDTMDYEILSTKIVKCTDTISALNIVNDVKATFYVVTNKTVL